MKNILITGCSSGFGYNAAKFLADKGHHVYATMRNVAGKNSAPANELTDYSDNIEVVEIDVTNDASVNKGIKKIDQLDVLINNAGLGYGGPLEAFTAQEVIDQLDLNIVGTFRMAKAVLPMMRKQGNGLIIQVSSTAGRAAFPGFGVYHASKWGLEGMSEALRYELAPLGIEVVLVEPGPFDTNFFGNVVMPKDEEVAKAYGHVMEFQQGFGSQVQSMFEDKDAPTDPQVVVDIFNELINMEPGTRPIRTVAGLDFGYREFNKATEKYRKDTLAFMNISEWDGPQKANK
ncbi:SDR family oxidoreductase [Marinigracilibium pacificum]|uniref:SDR family oxidoreductase n=1 Tax=Marinigracilibium pacificum TaxID=2729599 RepID=A0A848J6Q5_9BACT|nr:SDR family oxidoreductase [Marinigracilibium pacificum]NMM50069.1 SDR family oxidoreductase [Marinigracilibium pacificum]